MYYVQWHMHNTAAVYGLARYDMGKPPARWPIGVRAFKTTKGDKLDLSKCSDEVWHDTCVH